MEFQVHQSHVPSLQRCCRVVVLKNGLDGMERFDCECMHTFNRQLCPSPDVDVSVCFEVIYVLLCRAWKIMKRLLVENVLTRYQSRETNCLDGLFHANTVEFQILSERTKRFALLNDLSLNN